ncbi:MAG TPA: glycosyltransferase [Candidatus Krumholzibacteria bacterium]|nr:glycosyltransferase [Candidatus Krumholzibacteria bacterium]
MKVLVVNSSLRVGGAESMSIALANALALEGLDVYFASATGPLRDNLDARVRFLVTDNANQAASRVTHELLLYIKHHQFDVVHSHGGMCGLSASIAVKASKLQAVRVLTHHSRVFRRAPRWISGPVMRRCADHFIAISHDKQMDLRALGISPERISLIPNFVDVDAIATRVESLDRAATLRDVGVPEGARVLLMAGRVISAKRFDNFIRIAAEVARQMPDREVHALIIGDGPGLEEARRVAAREAAPASVHFLGYQRDIFPFLAASDVVVFPSEHPEVLPMFLIEASAAARPVVCSDIPGNREIITDGETGRVVSDGIAGFAAAAVALLRHPEQGALFAHAAQQRAQARFDRPAVARETIGVYQRLLAAKAPTR